MNIKKNWVVIVLTGMTIIFMIMACVFSYKAGNLAGWRECIEENNLYDRYYKNY